MAKLAFLFPGQGTQYVGMGLDFPNHKTVLTHAQALTHLDLMQVLTTGEQLNETQYTQLSVFLTSVLAYEVVQSLHPRVSGLTGFSLGEYTGLFVSGVFSLEDTTQLIHQRAQLMQAQTKQQDGFMAAILGLDATIIESALKQIQSGIVVCANYNSPVQTVISGDKKAYPEAETILKGLGAKRVLPLNVAGAFHSPLMHEAAQGFGQYLSQVTLHAPKIPLYLNTTAKPLVLDTLKTEMVNQIEQPVRFVQTIQNMAEDGFTHFLEIGPGQVLGPLVKKINPNLETFSFGQYEAVEQLKGWLSTHGFI